MKCNAIFLIKAFAIIGVVFHHIANRRFNADSIDTLKTLKSLFSWSVLSFIATAGWLHALSESHKSKSLTHFILHRARRLLLPFALLTLLYASAWQIIQKLHLSDAGERLASGYWEKITQTIPGDHYEPVAEQLYFLPLLFLVATCTQTAYAIAHKTGVLLLALCTLTLGITLTPDARNTGFSGGMLLFGILSYAGGFLLYYLDKNTWKWPSLAMLSLILVLTIGPLGIYKALPLILLGAAPLLEFMPHTIMHKVGEASGTIYAYHTPFILQPLIILSAAMPIYLQIPAALFAALTSVAACTIIHFALKDTRAKGLLL